MWAELTAKPLYIGILNLTPDSFSDGGLFMEPTLALARAELLVRTGARMLDLGAESTRPGSSPVDSEEEWRRLQPVLAVLKKNLPKLPLSLDTRHAEVAARGLAAGVSVINDVTGFSDPAMLNLAQASTCGLIAMRSRQQGEGFHMPPYDDPEPRGADRIIREMRTLLADLRRAGIPDGRFLLDPGFGFGTTYLEDLALWQALPRLPQALEWPAAGICIGISRKRFLAARTGWPTLAPAQRDGLTAQAHSEAMQWDYRVFRTHAIG